MSETPEDTETLLSETIDKLKRYGQEVSDVCYVIVVADDRVFNADRLAWISWEQFSSVADFEYDKGHGNVEIQLELTVVGEDWWLERREYDGAEWWVYQKLPLKPKKHLASVEKQHLLDSWEKHL